MSKWGHCSFLHSVRYSPFSPKTLQILTVDKVEGPFKFRCSCVQKVTPRYPGVMSELDITPGAVCVGVKVEDIVAPTLYEKNLETDQATKG